MAKKRKSGSKSHQFSQWQIGLLLILGGLVAHTILDILMPLKPPLSNAERGQAFGRGLAAILAIVAGIVMIVMHFVRRKK